MIELVQLIIFGVVLGSILALGAVGLSLTYGILRFANFAHGDVMTLGAYLALPLVAVIGLPPLLSFPIAAGLTVLCVLAIDRMVYRRLRRTAPVILLIASVGVALALRSLIQLIWGPDNQVYASGIQIPYRFGGLILKPDHLYIVLGAALLVAGVHFFLQYTRTGKAMRAMSDNPDLARVSGIDTEKIIVWTWILGGGLAAIAGMFLAFDTRLHPVAGWRLLLPVFAAAILGGIGRPYGAIAGGLIIGIAQELSTLVVSPAYKPAVAFAIMVAVLIVRPRGIFAGRST